MKKTLLILAATILVGAQAFGQVATQPGDIRNTLPPQESGGSPFLLQGHVSPFENELNYYYTKRNIAGAVMWTGAVSTVGGLAGTSTLLTMQGLGLIHKDVNIWLVASSYALTAVAAGFTAWGFFDWYTNSNAYADTIRLASQYYNMVER